MSFRFYILIKLLKIIDAFEPYNFSSPFSLARCTAIFSLIKRNTIIALVRITDMIKAITELLLKNFSFLISLYAVFLLFILFIRIKIPYVAKNKAINKSNVKIIPIIISSIMSILHCHFIFILRSVEYQNIFYICLIQPFLRVFLKLFLCPHY